MPYPSRTIDADELIADFDDHTEALYLGDWTELRIGNLRLLRRDDGAIEAEEIEEDWRP